MNKIVFRIDGPEQNDHHLDLAAFVRKTGQFLALLKSIAKDGNADGVVFQIVNLSHSSPATVECEPRGQNALAAFDKVGETLLLLKDKQAGHFSQPVLSAMENLARYNSKKIAWAEIQTISENEDKCIYKFDDRFKLDGPFTEILSKVSNAEETAEEKVISTIDGKLGEINIRGGNTFKIYSSLSHISPVTCKFSDELLDDVKDALGRFVSVWGECFYGPDAAFPYKINVRKMEVLPPREELPSLRDLRGIAPDATGGKSSEQFVRESRDKWG